MRNYKAIEEFMMQRLQNNLPPDLYYHAAHHTMDVLHAAELIGADEKLSEHDFFLLKVAVLYHDSGFLNSYGEHEEAGCKLAKTDLPGFGLNEEEIEIICGMIIATKLPQNPKTPLEKIIADADLDYLGTGEFETISNTLFEEAKIYRNIKTRQQWDQIQANFLSRHHYFTNFCIQNREPEKQRHLKEILGRL
jgi:uncharacterized protein